MKALIRVFALAVALTVIVMQCAATPLGAAQPAEGQEAMSGRWNGTIHIAGQELEFHVTFAEDSAGLAATMDIPAQGASGLVLTEVRFEAATVHFELQAGPGLAVWEGDLDGDEVAGTFTQAGLSGTFSMTRASTGEGDDRPYREAEVEFASGGIGLAGTLTIPSGEGPFPAVAFITGSGPQNRDEELLGFRVFGILADSLARAGIASLRYDDRGVGGSGGNVLDATAGDFAGDALAAVGVLRERPEIDPDAVGLVGHSEGGIVAPLAASRSSDVSFLVLLAGTSVPGIEVLMEQGALIARANGASEEAIAEQHELQRYMMEVIERDGDWEEFEARSRDQMRRGLESASPEQPEIDDVDAWLDAQIQGLMLTTRSRWFRAFVAHDPADALRATRVPVLALFGEKDLQVPPHQNVEPMRAALKDAGNEQVTIEVIPGVNHLFQAAETGTPGEYGSLEKAFAPGVVDRIIRWIDRTAVASR